MLTLDEIENLISGEVNIDINEMFSNVVFSGYKLEDKVI